MTQLLFYTENLQEREYKKIGQSLYFHEESKTFFRLSLLPHTVIFQNEQIYQPHIAALTPYDPYFYLIGIITKGRIALNQLPSEFRNIDMTRIATIKNQGGQSYIIEDTEKIFDFLEQKVQKVQKCLAQQLGQKMLEVDHSMVNEKEIREQTVTILRSEIDNKQLIDRFAKQRYNYQNIRKLQPYDFQVEQAVVKRKTPAKKQSKKQQVKLQHGQKTLGAFFTKKMI